LQKLRKPAIPADHLVLAATTTVVLIRTVSVPVAITVTVPWSDPPS